jgi:hypothetical protein
MVCPDICFAQNTLKQMRLCLKNKRHWVRFVDNIPRMGVSLDEIDRKNLTPLQQNALIYRAMFLSSRGLGAALQDLGPGGNSYAHAWVPSLQSAQGLAIF